MIRLVSCDVISLALNTAVGSRPNWSSECYSLCDGLHVQVPVLQHADLGRSAVIY